ncbi:MAG: hypothetical protein AAFY54_08285 [Cyanobacteria bacterium J06648_10]
MRLQSKGSIRLPYQKFLFILGIILVYTALIVWLDYLQGPYYWDEKIFWETSLTFSDRLFPTLNELRDYRELSTPLPFIIFGALEYLFDQGIFLGRLLNLLLSVSMVFIIGWPTQQKGGRALLCLLGLFLCPYYLFLSGRLYTEMIACFWVLLGFVGYTRRRYWLSGLAFVLAIASRQYMLAFPVAITIYELSLAALNSLRNRQLQFAPVQKWLAPLIASLSIFGWFYLFQGLTPETALDVRPAPEIQKTAWAIAPGGALNFLGFVTLYMVIPELFLLQPVAKLKALRQKLKVPSKVWIIAAVLLFYFLFFPPLSDAAGNLKKVANALPYDALRLLLFYGLALVACLRFSRPNLLSILVFINSFIMVKAFPWDRYILPLVVVFWYIKANGLEEKFSFPKSEE